MRSLYRISDKNFIDAVKSSPNIHQALLKLGMNARGNAYVIFRKRCKILNIDLPKPNQNTDKYKKQNIRNGDLVD